MVLRLNPALQNPQGALRIDGRGGKRSDPQCDVVTLPSDTGCLGQDVSCKTAQQVQQEMDSGWHRRVACPRMKAGPVPDDDVLSLRIALRPLRRRWGRCAGRARCGRTVRPTWVE